MTKIDANKISKCLCMGRIVSVYSSDETSTSVEDVKSWTVRPGGIAGLNAFALAKLGIPAGFIGCVGNDDLGLSLKHALEVLNIDTKGIRIVSDAQTAWLWSLRHPNGDRSFHSAPLSLEQFADCKISKFDIDAEWFEDGCFFIPQAGLLGLEKGREAVNFAKEVTEKVRGTVFFDANFRRYVWQTREEAVELTTKFAKTCPFVQLSLEDSKLFFNVETVAELAKLLPNARGILLTKAERGCEYLLDGNLGASPGFKVNVFDSSVAGDAFFTAFISKLACFGIDSIRDPEACREFARFANAAGALSVTRTRGPDAFADANEIEELISSVYPDFVLKNVANT